MKLSTTFVLIAAAFTGSADAAKIIQGNLYADVFAGANEDPAAASPKDTFLGCLAKCSKTSRSTKSSDDLADKTEEDVGAGLASCAMACYGTDEETRSKLRGVISEEKLKTCATEAADRFREVSGRSCGSYKSMKCSKCSDDTDNSCRREERRCEQCASQLRRSQSSLRRVGRAFQECIAPESAPGSAVVADISVQEEPAPSADPAAPAADPAELQLEECVSSCSVLGKPNKSSALSTSRNDIEAGLKGCLETCYEIASNSDAIVKNRLTNQVPMDVALGCAETAAKKYRQVSGSCNTMKSIKCKSCKSGDCQDVTDPGDQKKCQKKLDKCEKEYDDCTKCASQARRARSSVKRVAKELDKCIAGVEDTESAVEIA